MCGQPDLVIGSKPIDDGNFIFTAEERSEFIKREPKAKKFLRPFIGSEEFINGGDRSILYLEDATPQELRDLPLVRERVEAVRTIRLASRRAGTRQLDDTPTRYYVTVIPKESFLVIHAVSSERRSAAPHDR